MLARRPRSARGRDHRRCQRGESGSCGPAQRASKIRRYGWESAPSPCVAPCRVHRALHSDCGRLGARRRAWVHEIKHDGYRLMVRRDSDRVRLFTRRSTVRMSGLASKDGRCSSALWRGWTRFGVQEALVALVSATRDVLLAGARHYQGHRRYESLRDTGRATGRQTQ